MLISSLFTVIMEQLDAQDFHHLMLPLNRRQTLPVLRRLILPLHPLLTPPVRHHVIPQLHLIQILQNDQQQVGKNVHIHRKIKRMMKIHLLYQCKCFIFHLNKQNDNIHSFFKSIFSPITSAHGSVRGKQMKK